MNVRGVSIPMKYVTARILGPSSFILIAERKKCVFILQYLKISNYILISSKKIGQNFSLQFCVIFFLMRE